MNDEWLIIMGTKHAPTLFFREGVETLPYGIDNAKCKMNNEELWALRTAVCMRDVEGTALPRPFCPLDISPTRGISPSPTV